MYFEIKKSPSMFHNYLFNWLIQNILILIIHLLPFTFNKKSSKLKTRMLIFRLVPRGADVRPINAATRPVPPTTGRATALET